MGIAGRRGRRERWVASFWHSQSPSSGGLFIGWAAAISCETFCPDHGLPLRPALLLRLSRRQARRPSIALRSVSFDYCRSDERGAQLSSCGETSNSRKSLSCLSGEVEDSGVAASPTLGIEAGMRRAASGRGEAATMKSAQRNGPKLDSTLRSCRAAAHQTTGRVLIHAHSPSAQTDECLC